MEGAFTQRYYPNTDVSRNSSVHRLLYNSFSLCDERFVSGDITSNFDTLYFHEGCLGSILYRFILK